MATRILPVSGFIRVADLAREGGADRAVRRSAERGSAVRVARGRFLPVGQWSGLDRDGQYKAKIHAWVETTRTPQVFSHWSAAALWGYPIIGAWPNRIHVTLGLRSGQRSTRGVARHLAVLGDDDVMEFDGLLVTSPFRTIVDLARVAGFASGVAACDYALAPIDRLTSPLMHLEREALAEAAEKLTGLPGVRRLRSVVEFADGRSGSPGESLSRVVISRLHLPAPELQFEVVDRDGQGWHCDFGWPGHSLLGEFDGMVKYTRDRYLEGREVAEVVIEEKLREDAIRLATGFGMARWTWPVVSDPAHLQKLLATAGLRPAR